MKIETMKRNNETIAVVNSAETLVRDLQSLRELLSAVRAETGAKRIALSKSAVSESFFLLSTGLAGAAKASVAQAGAKLAIFGDYSRYLGTDAAHFSPGEPCTRGHVVTFLYRFEHSPDVSGANPFTDVRASDYFCSPVLWAVSRGVTNGVTATQFGPANGCTRGQVVTFLYRDLHRVPTPETLPDDAPVLR